MKSHVLLPSSIMLGFLLFMASCTSMDEQNGEDLEQLIKNRYKIDRAYGDPSCIETMPEKKPIKPSPADPKEFEYISAMDNAFGADDFIRIKGNGQGIYVFFDGLASDKSPIWRKREYAVSTKDIIALRKVISESHFLLLPESYCLRNAYDGIRRWVTVRSAGRSKRVYLSNCVPLEMVPVLKKEYEIAGDWRFISGPSVQVDAKDISGGIVKPE